MINNNPEAFLYLLVNERDAGIAYTHREGGVVYHDVTRSNRARVCSFSLFNTIRVFYLQFFRDETKMRPFFVFLKELN